MSKVDKRATHRKFRNHDIWIMGEHLILLSHFRTLSQQGQVWPLRKKTPTIQQLTTMLATSKNVLFPGYNHLLTTSADDPTLWLSPERKVTQHYIKTALNETRS